MYLTGTRWMPRGGPRNEENESGHSEILAAGPEVPSAALPRTALHLPQPLRSPFLPDPPTLLRARIKLPILIANGSRTPRRRTCDETLGSGIYLCDGRGGWRDRPSSRAGESRRSYECQWQGGQAQPRLRASRPGVPSCHPDRRAAQRFGFGGLSRLSDQDGKFRQTERSELHDWSRQQGRCGVGDTDIYDSAFKYAWSPSIKGKDKVELTTLDEKHVAGRGRMEKPLKFDTGDVFDYNVSFSAPIRTWEEMQAIRGFR